MKLNEISSPPDNAATVKIINDFLKKGNCIVMGSGKTSVDVLDLDRSGKLNLRSNMLYINNSRRKQLKAFPPQIVLKNLRMKNVDLESWDALPPGIEKLYVEKGKLPNPDGIPESIKVLNVTDATFNGSVLPLFNGVLDFHYQFKEDNATISMYTISHGQIYVIVESGGDDNEFSFDSVFELQEWMMDNNLEAYV